MGQTNLPPNSREGCLHIKYWSECTDSTLLCWNWQGYIRAIQWRWRPQIWPCRLDYRSVGQRKYCKIFGMKIWIGRDWWWWDTYSVGPQW